MPNNFSPFRQSQTLPNTPLKTNLARLILGGLLLLAALVILVVLIRQPQIFKKEAATTGTVRCSWEVLFNNQQEIRYQVKLKKDGQEIDSKEVLDSGTSVSTSFNVSNPSSGSFSCQVSVLEPDSCSTQDESNTCSFVGPPVTPPTATASPLPTATPTLLPTETPASCPAPGNFNLHCIWDSAANDGSGCYKINLRWTPVSGAIGADDYHWELYQNPHRPETGGPIFEDGEANQGCGTGGVCDAITQKCTDGSYWARVRVNSASCSTSWAKRSVGCGGGGGEVTPSPTPTTVEPPTATPGGDGGPGPTTTPIPTSTPGGARHSACRYNQCVEIPGAGPDECQTIFDCLGPVTPTPIPPTSTVGPGTPTPTWNPIIPTSTPSSTPPLTLTPTATLAPTTTTTVPPTLIETPKPTAAESPQPTEISVSSPTSQVQDLPDSGIDLPTLVLLGVALSLVVGGSVFLIP